MIRICQIPVRPVMLHGAELYLIFWNFQPSARKDVVSRIQPARRFWG
jgi:hypothetical protein